MKKAVKSNEIAAAPFRNVCAPQKRQVKIREMKQEKSSNGVKRAKNQRESTLRIDL